MAKTRSEELKKSISSFITYKDTLKPLATGKDLKRMGIKEGPIFKKILEALKEAKVDLNLQTKDEELRFIEKYLAGGEA